MSSNNDDTSLKEIENKNNNDDDNLSMSTVSLCNFLASPIQYLIASLR